MDEMDDEELFRRSMRELGVDPLRPAATGLDDPRLSDRPRRGAPPHEPPPAEKPPCDPEDLLFLQSVERLMQPVDKDRRKRPPEDFKVRRLKTRDVRTIEPEATLDLHGRTVEEGLRSLEAFITSAAGEGLRTVEIVTGKGLRSAGGFSVLRRAVERWLYEMGKRRVRAFAEAPRHRGGRGALILILRN